MIERLIAFNATVYFVGRNLYESRDLRFIGSLNKRRRADDICHGELPRRVDRTVHMAFGGDIDDGGEWRALPALLHDPFDKIPIADVTMDKSIGIGRCEIVKILPAAGIGQRVDVNDRMAAQHRQTNEIRPDK